MIIKIIQENSVFIKSYNFIFPGYMYYNTTNRAKSIILSTGAGLKHLICHSNLPNTETCKHQ